MKKSILLSIFLGCMFIVTDIAAQWVQQSSLPAVSRHHPICFALDGKGYVVCGNADPDEVAVPYVKDFYSFDPSTDRWTRELNFPGDARGFAVGLNYEGKGYAGFGVNTSERLNDLWEYDPVTEEWTQLPDCPCLGRTHPAFLAAQGKIYVGMGGVGTNAKDWWSYDIEDKRWTEEEDLPGIARHHPYYFTVDDIPYVGFGHSANAIHNDFYKFDPATRKWVRLKDFPSHGRVAGTHFALNGKGYILAGDNERHRYDEGEFWEYEPKSDSWIQLPTFPEDGRWAPGAFAIGSTGYFFGGLARNTSEYHNDLWSYELGTTSTDNEFLNGIEVSPNPVVSTIKLDGQWDKIDVINILDASGREIRSVQPQSEIQVEDLPSGVYHLQLMQDDESRVLKFVRL